MDKIYQISGAARRGASKKLHVLSARFFGANARVSAPLPIGIRVRSHADSLRGLPLQWLVKLLPSSMLHLPRSSSPKHKTLLIRLLLLGVLASNPVAAAIVALGQDAVSAAVVRRLFTDQGRRVLAGDVASCNFAYVEQPVVAFRGGRIVLRLRFAGRAGLSSNGRCMGASDAFAATVSGHPVIDGDTISVRDVRMEEGKQEYRAMLEPLLRRQLPALLGSNLRGEFTRHLESTVQDFRMAVREFRLQEVTANDGVLTVRFDFALSALPR